MTDISDLLFLISSETRLEIIKKIQDSPSSQTNLAKAMDMVIPEASRHLAKLVEAKLVGKNEQNFYEISNFGRLVLATLPTLEFLVKNREYFVTHNINELPLEFIYRLGELENAEYKTTVSNILRHIEQVLEEAQEFVWLMADQPLINPKSLLENFENNKVRLRIIRKGNLDVARIIQRKLGDRVEIADANVIFAGMALNEKTAGIVFNNNDGTVDFNSGFAATDLKSYKWCFDFFSHNWEQNKS